MQLHKLQLAVLDHINVLKYEIRNTNIMITTELLFENIELFEKRTVAHVKECSEILQIIPMTFGMMSRLTVLRELWLEINISKPFPRLITFFTPNEDFNEFMKEKFGNGNEMENVEDLDGLVSKLGDIRIGATKINRKLSSDQNKYSLWLEQVSKWRATQLNHPDYHPDHPEEQNFNQKRNEVEKKIDHLTSKKIRYIKEAAKLFKTMQNRETIILGVEQYSRDYSNYTFDPFLPKILILVPKLGVNGQTNGCELNDFK